MKDERESLPLQRGPHIGLLNEKALHASLREWYARPGDRHEVSVGRFVIDIVRGGQLVEIQTRGLASLKVKLHTLTKTHRLRLVHPIAEEKWIVRLPKDGGGETSRRRSPKRGRDIDVFREIVSFPELLTNPNFSLEVLIIREEEIRQYEGRHRWRTRGWTVVERRLLGVIERRLYETPADWQVLLPTGLTTFTAAELGEAAGISRRLAQQMVYCLRKAAIVEYIGKQGRAHLYRVVPD